MPQLKHIWSHGVQPGIIKTKTISQCVHGSIQKHGIIHIYNGADEYCIDSGSDLKFAFINLHLQERSPWFYKIIGGNDHYHKRQDQRSRRNQQQRVKSFEVKVPLAEWKCVIFHWRELHNVWEICLPIVYIYLIASPQSEVTVEMEVRQWDLRDVLTLKLKWLQGEK